MRIKHTFFFTMLVGLTWVGLLFGYQGGPAQNGAGVVNGVFTGVTCNQSGCHNSYALNASGGSLSLTGLPAQWTPGTTYPLVITVQRPASIYGFQISAVWDSSNPPQSAGTLSKGKTSGSDAARISVVTDSSSGIQVVEHNILNLSYAPTQTFYVNWTAPLSTSKGAVRFNLAGNAGNADQTPNGDYIYTLAKVVSPASTTSNGNPTQAFSIANFSSASYSTDGSGSTNVGYATIQASSGSTTPSGVEIFGYRANNILVSETGVPASPLVSQGRIYAEVNGPVNTGLAIANPNSQAATLNVTFTDSSGNAAGTNTVQIPANGQIAAFLNQSPFIPPTANPVAFTFQGSFSFTSNVPVSAIALRGFTNERSEFLMSTLPVIDTTISAATGTQTIPHFAAGGGWTTQVILINPTSTPMAGTIKFFAGTGQSVSNGTPINVTVGSQVAASAVYSIPAGSAQKLAVSGGSSTASGSIEVVPTGGGAGPVPLAVFSYKPGLYTVTEAGAPANSSTAFRMYVQASGTSGQPGYIESGIAVANTSASQATVTFSLFNPDGSSTGLVPVSTTLPAFGQVAEFLPQMFPNLPASFSGGVLEISSNSGAISVVGLRGRYNERSDFLITTTPPTSETAPAGNAELLFPHLVNGGGYTTQFILFSGTAGQSSAGTLSFFTQAGNPLSLVLQ